MRVKIWVLVLVFALLASSPAIVAQQGKTPSGSDGADKKKYEDVALSADVY